MHLDDPYYGPSVPGFYNRAQVCEITTLSDTTIWRLEKRKKFPSPVKLSHGRVGWPRAAVDAWIKERMEAAEAQAA